MEPVTDTNSAALAAAKAEADRIQPERRRKLEADFDRARRAAEQHSTFRRQP